jgi:trimethylamine---corrinoid protein Co-methyltransferase
LMNSEYYYPHTTDRQRREDWEEAGSLDARQRARLRAQEILQTHQPVGLDTAVDAAIRQRFQIVLPV